MSLPRNMILTGFMGTGKTTVGHLLADRLGWEAVDTDHLIESREGKGIPEIFSTEGETRFREIETEVIRGLAEKNQTIIMLGGGAITQPENVQPLKHAGLLICLHARPETILSRVGKDENRPLLAGGDRLAVITTLLKDREKAYRAADLHIQTDAKTPEQIAIEIHQRVSQDETTC